MYGCLSMGNRFRSGRRSRRHRLMRCLPPKADIRTRSAASPLIMPATWKPSRSSRKRVSTFRTWTRRVPKSIRLIARHRRWEFTSPQRTPAAGCPAGRNRKAAPNRDDPAGRTTRPPVRPGPRRAPRQPATRPGSQGSMTLVGPSSCSACVRPRCRAATLPAKRWQTPE